MRYLAVIGFPIYPFYYLLTVVGNSVYVGVAPRLLEISTLKVTYNFFQIYRKMLWKFQENRFSRLIVYKVQTHIHWILSTNSFSVIIFIFLLSNSSDVLKIPYLEIKAKSSKPRLRLLKFWFPNFDDILRNFLNSVYLQMEAFAF